MENIHYMYEMQKSVNYSEISSFYLKLTNSKILVFQHICLLASVFKMARLFFLISISFISIFCELLLQKLFKKEKWPPAPVSF